MCLLLFAYRLHPDYPIILAANRDEFYSRPSLPAQFWDDEPHILAGRDLEAGGTWLGITKTGRIAAVTNYHEEQKTEDRLLSRGSLVSDFLRRDITPQLYADIVADNGRWYGAFNIVFGMVDDLYCCSNRKSGCEPLGQGIHGLGNGFLDDGSLKVKKGREGLRDILSTGGDITPGYLFSLLNDKERAEGKCSPIFIEGDEYGTRCSTVILIDKERNVRFYERSISPGGKQAGTVEYEFRLEA